MTPKELVPNVVPGPPKLVSFNKLKNSARNCSVVRSCSVVFLRAEKSQFTVPGWRTSGSVRAVFPNVNGGGCENTDVSKYRSSRLTVDPPSFALFPELLGREPPPKE